MKLLYKEKSSAAHAFIHKSQYIHDGDTVVVEVFVGGTLPRDGTM